MTTRRATSGTFWPARNPGHTTVARSNAWWSRGRAAAKLVFSMPIELSAYLRRTRTTYIYKAKIRRIQQSPLVMERRSHETHSGEFLRRSREFLRQHFGRYRDIRWHTTYAAANGIFSAEYIPEDVFYNSIEPSFNSMIYADAYNDKNTPALIGLDKFGPPSLAHIVDGKPFDSTFKAIRWGQLAAIIKEADSEIVIKSSIGGGGADVHFAAATDSWTLLQAILDQLRQEQGRANVIIERVIRQSPDLAAISPTSLNTMRIMTARIFQDVHLISSVLRMGRQGSRVDNQSAGGISCGIEFDGSLKSRAYDKSFESYDYHPDSRVSFRGRRLTYYNEAVTMCLALHEKLPYFDLVSWDVAVREDGKILIVEYNIRSQEINFHQVNNGPLFNPITETAMRYYKERLATRRAVARFWAQKATYPR